MKNVTDRRNANLQGRLSFAAAGFAHGIIQNGID
jgi:hypothetical protein